MPQFFNWGGLRLMVSARFVINFKNGYSKASIELRSRLSNSFPTTENKEVSLPLALTPTISKEYLLLHVQIC